MAAGDITAVRSEASDKDGGASFDGVDDYVEIPHHASQLGANLSNGFTISAWIYARTSGENALGHIIQKAANEDGIDGFSWMIRGSNTNLQFMLNGDTSKPISAAGSLIFGTWQHYIITISAIAKANIYLNGTLTGNANQSVTGVIADIISLNDLVIGNANSSNRTFDGLIKDVKMWNRVLTTDEIAADYAGYNSPRNGLILDVPLRDDYNDKALGLTGTNSGTYLTNTLTNKIKADMHGMNLPTATDKIIAIKRRGSPTIVAAKRTP